MGCLVEMTKNKSIRVECHEKFAVATNASINATGLLHPNCRILQQDAKLQCLFGNQKLASFGLNVRMRSVFPIFFKLKTKIDFKGILFNVKPSPTAFIMSSILLHGTTSIPATCVRLPVMDYDYTTNVFFHQSAYGPQLVPECQEVRIFYTIDLNVCCYILHLETTFLPKN